MKNKEFIKQQINTYNHNIKANKNNSIGCSGLFFIFLIFLIIKFSSLAKFYFWFVGFLLLVTLLDNHKYILFYEDQIKDLSEKYFAEVNYEKFVSIRKQRTKLDKTFKVAGTSHRLESLDSLIRLLVTREDYIGDFMTYTNKEIRESHERIYKYSGCTTDVVKYIEEPENEHDNNAIKVYIHDLWIGYVPKSINSELKKFLSENEYIINSSAQIVGGKYKEYSFVQDKVVTGNMNYGVQITFKAISKS